MSIFTTVKITPIASGTYPLSSITPDCIAIQAKNSKKTPPGALLSYSLPSTLHRHRKGIRLEGIPLLFQKGSITGSVWSLKGGRTVIPVQHAMEAHADEKM